jgi:hypothetical protein
LGEVNAGIYAERWSQYETAHLRRGSKSAQFDGTYEIDGLAVGHSYTVYAGAR